MIAAMGRRLGAIVSAVILLLTIGLLPIQVNAASTVRVAVEVFVCSNDRADVPMLSMYAAGSGPLKMQVAPRWTFNGDAWTASVDVPQGHYVVSARSKGCGSRSVQWYALPGEIRHIALALNQGNRVAMIGDFMYAGVVYGVLPSRTAQVELLSADSAIGEQTRRQIPTDAETFQQDYLPRGRYVLRVSLGGVIVSREITLPSSNAVVRADFTATDAAEIVRQQARGAGFVQVFDSMATSSQTFHLGNAEVDGWISNPLIPPSDYNIRELRVGSNVLAALAAAQQFLIKESAIPPQFKNLTQWSARVLDGGNNNIVIGLLPNDPAAWEKVAPPLQGHCTTGVGMANILLNFNVASGEIVGTPTICPKV
jgi:hypothetical protein